jgi:hypothetical protein
MKILLLFFLIIGFYGHTNQLKALYNSLDPKSVMQHVAFYELYSDSKEGQAALNHAWQLLSQGTLHQQNTPLPTLDLKEIISLITRQSFEPNVMLNQEQLQLQFQSVIQEDRLLSVIQNVLQDPRWPVIVK